MEFAKPQKEHAFLEKLVGTWVGVSQTLGAETVTGAAMPPWTETFRSVGGLWFIGEGTGQMPGGHPGSTIITLGYDAEAGQYVGTWIGSMMTKLWIYKGRLEADGRTLTLEAEGPSMDGSGDIVVYHDVITWIDDNHRRFAGSIQQADGTFREFMSSDFKRTA